MDSDRGGLSWAGTLTCPWHFGAPLFHQCLHRVLVALTFAQVLGCVDSLRNVSTDLSWEFCQWCFKNRVSLPYTHRCRFCAKIGSVPDNFLHASQVTMTCAPATSSRRTSHNDHTLQQLRRQSEHELRTPETRGHGCMGSRISMISIGLQCALWLPTSKTPLFHQDVAHVSAFHLIWCWCEAHRHPYWVDQRSAEYSLLLDWRAKMPNCWVAPLLWITSTTFLQLIFLESTTWKGACSETKGHTDYWRCYSCLLGVRELRSTCFQTPFFVVYLTLRSPLIEEVLRFGCEHQKIQHNPCKDGCVYNTSSTQVADGQSAHGIPIFNQPGQPPPHKVFLHDLPTK